MMDREDYRQKWDWKLGWYARNGFVLGANVFTSQDDDRGGLDSQALTETAEQIKVRLY